MAAFYPINVPLVNYFFYNYTLTASGPNLPLAGGFIFFREDEDHTVPKPTYSDVSDPNAPVVNPNPVPMNAVGAIPLFYAEEGFYYIVITGPDADFDNPIWTFEHVDFSGGAGLGGTNVINYVPNGQFLLHNVQNAHDDVEQGEITQAVTDVAWGGWTFRRPEGSTATDLVTFERYDAWNANPTGNPRYAIRLQCTDPGTGDAYKSLRVTWPNVNKFASAQPYTIAFSGMDNFAGSAPIDVYLVKNFGTGGDDETNTLLTTFNLTPTETAFSYIFVFGTNAEKVIGALDDDFVALDFRVRTDEEIDVLMTDFDLEAGELIDPVYPATTDRQDVSAALGGGFPVPNPDGSDLYLTPRLTATGWMYDDAEIGEVIAESNQATYINSLSTVTNKLLSDGSSYPTAGFSPLGIPFARLQSKYWNPILNASIYGTGASYFNTATSQAKNNQLIVSNNSDGVVDAVVDGTAPTGFTFGVVYTGTASNFNCKAWAGNFLTTTGFFIERLEVGTVANATGGTAGYNITEYQAGDPDIPQITFVNPASTTTAGTYFLFSTPAINYYVWFQIDGAGSDPAVSGRTGIKINLDSTDNSNMYALKIALALNSAGQESTINTTVASTIPASSFFTLSSNVADYYVWYAKDGVGTDPKITNAKGIRVDVLGTDTAVQVAIKTQTAMNMLYFAVPNLQGQFLRGLGGGMSDRYSMVPYVTGDNLGTFQISQNKSHLHSIDGMSTDGQSGGGLSVLSGSASTGYAGIYESRPDNTNVIYSIRY